MQQLAFDWVLSVPRVGCLSLADNSHITAEMGGQQIQSLCLGFGDVSFGQFTLTMSLSLKTCCYPPTKLK